MTDLFEIVQRLCKSKNITIAGLERECGFGNGTIKKWSVATPSGDRLSKVADYFNVSVDYLLGRTLTDKDEKDIAKDLSAIIEKISYNEDGPANFDGTELSPESLELFKDELEIALRRLKLINKEKYNPTKNKK